MARQSRQTKQKELISQEIETLGAFFDADDLFLKVSSKDSKIGKATIYRYLKGLVESGGIHSFVCDRKALYSTSEHHHSHFTCEKCLEVSHISISKMDFLKTQVKGKVCHVQIDVTGVCEKCLSKNN